MEKEKIVIKDNDSFENDLAKAVMMVMLKHQIETGYNGRFGQWIDCVVDFRYLHNAGGVYVEDLNFNAVKSKYRR